MWFRDIVCDFSSYDAGRSLYLYNQPDPSRTTSETPFFCYSHLIMKINISGKGPAPTVQPKMVFGPNDGFLETNVALNSTYLQVTPLSQLRLLFPSAAAFCCSLPKFVMASCALTALSTTQSCGDLIRATHGPLGCSAIAETPLPVPLQSLMERALAGQFDRSLKFGHSSGIWQVNDKGWEDDHDHIDFDVSPAVCLFFLVCTPAQPSCQLHVSARWYLCNACDDVQLVCS